MKFSSVIGQHTAKAYLQRLIAEGHLPHALLISGPTGSGKLPLALAVASALLCTERQEDNVEACGTCHNCRMVQKLVHPDLHFVFPVIKATSSTGKPVSDNYIKEWRDMLLSSPYFDAEMWLEAMGVKNQQMIIYEAESDQIQHKLSLVASQGGYRVMVIWLPECMNLSAANKLLKILEEPPAQTVFLLVSEDPERLLPTILSRTQTLKLPPLTQDELTAALMERNGLEEREARLVARLSEGNYVHALKQLQVNDENNTFFDMFVLLMRLAYQRKIKDLRAWAEQVAAWGRERQKRFLDYGQRLVRENFIYNFREPSLNYETRQEADFSANFARFINERNVIGIMDEFTLARRDVERNVNPQMIFFDFCLKIIVLLVK